MATEGSRLRRRDFAIFLGLELVAVAWAGLSFRLIADRRIAGLCAGLYFVLSAAWMLFWLGRRARAWRTFTFYPLVVHLVGVSIPMLGVRLWNWDQAFGEIHIWGLEGPQFHRLSTTVFGILIAATVADLFRRKPKAVKNSTAHEKHKFWTTRA